MTTLVVVAVAATILGLAFLAFGWAWRRQSPTTWADELLQLMRSSVRIIVTIAATAYVFGGIAVLVWLYCGPKDATKITETTLAEIHDIFMVGVPLASGVIGYWFASRSAEKHLDQRNGAPNGSNGQEGNDGQVGQNDNDPANTNVTPDPP